MPLLATTLLLGAGASDANNARRLARRVYGTFFSGTFAAVGDQDEEERLSGTLEPAHRARVLVGVTWEAQRLCTSWFRPTVDTMENPERKFTSHPRRPHPRQT